MVKATFGKVDVDPRSSRNVARTTATKPRFARAPRTRPHGSCRSRVTRAQLPLVWSGADRHKAEQMGVVWLGYPKDIERQ